MVLTGTVVNALAIAIGGLIGMKLRFISEKMKATMMHGIGISVIVIGLQMAMKTQNMLIVILSLVLGSVVGEYWQIEAELNRWGEKIEERGRHVLGDSQIAEGFITATLLYSIGAMAILGAMQSGLEHDHQLLYTKSILDGITAILLASTLGAGVLIAAIPVFVYQGSIALLAFFFGSWLEPEWEDVMIAGITSVGGIMIIALGCNLLGITKIRVSNMLPALVIIILIEIMLRWLPLG